MYVSLNVASTGERYKSTEVHVGDSVRGESDKCLRLT